jgi:fucose permease
MPGASTLMFLMHAVYGLGATASPLVSTQFVKHVQARVYLYYAASLGLAAVTAILLLVVFQMRTDDQVVGFRASGSDAEKDKEKEKEKEKEKPQVEVEGAGTTEESPFPAEKNTYTSPTATATAEGQLSPAETEAARAKAEKKAATAHQSGSKMKRIVRSPAVWLLAIYILIYVGVEVTIGGWATSFLVDERGGDDSSGYVSSGFFGGLTVGRVVLIPVTAWLGGWTSVWV